MYLVGLDALDQFEVFLENVAQIQVYLIAQTKGSVVYNLEDVLAADPNVGSWQAIEADNYNVPEAANGVFLRIENRDSGDPGGQHSSRGLDGCVDPRTWGTTLISWRVPESTLTICGMNS